MVTALIKGCESLKNFPREELHKFIDCYEVLYYFEKEKNLTTRFSHAVKSTVDYLITHENE